KRAPVNFVDTVREHPGVRSALGRIQMGILIDLPHVPEPISGVAISLPDSRRPILNDVLLKAGAWFSDPEEPQAIVNESFAAAHGIRPGFRILVNLPDRLHEVLVTGTAMSPEFVYLIPSGGGLAPDPSRFGVIYLPETFLRRACDLEGACNQIIGVAHDGDETSLRGLLGDLSSMSDPWGLVNAYPMADTPSVRFLADEIQGLRINSRIMPSIFLLVAALILNIIMTRLVHQQRSVIGTLKAIGFGRAVLVRHYLSYGVIIGLAGGLAGLLLGWMLEALMLSIYRDFYTLPDIRIRLYPDLYLTGIVISVLCAVFGAVRGVFKAASLQPAEAMRPMLPEKGAPILLEKLGIFWRPLPFRWKMILRAVFRNPFRSLVTVFASCVSTAFILTTLCSTDALDYLMEHEFGQVARQDVTVSLRDPAGRPVIAEAAGLPGVVFLEPQLAVTTEIRSEARRKKIGMIGIVPDRRLNTPGDRSGRSMIPPRSGVILSAKLAEILDVREGDAVYVRPLIARRTEVRMPVMATVDTWLGLSAWMDIETLSSLVGEEWCANSLLCKTLDPRHHQDLFGRLKESPRVIGVGERVRSFRLMDETFGKTMGASIGIMVLFACLISFGSVFNTALVSLSERQREVGTLRVLGYSSFQVTRIFSGESLLLNVLGMAAGF
ncbi:MAG TPA: FtsX-like permease family protein, partial [Candidatus Sumerlaeota bacterium]|nr:FtsX-like permease family protein [Candidatus Sumerlaeota bacterium]